MAERSEPTSTEIDRMAFIQREVEKAVIPYRENTEAAIVVGALMRVARILLDLYPEGLRAELVEAASAYLAHRDLERADRLFRLPSLLNGPM